MCFPGSWGEKMCPSGYTELNYYDWHLKQCFAACAKGLCQNVLLGKFFIKLA